MAWKVGNTPRLSPIIIIIIIIINILIKVTLNEIPYRGTLQSQWSTLTDCTSRKAEENVISQYRVLDYFYLYISLTVKLVAKSANIRSLFKVSKNP